jgi:glutamine amidotransferase
MLGGGFVIKIIDYKAGNAPSVLHATRHLGYTAELVQQAEGLIGATHIILPGVGSARATMDSLHEMDMLPVLEKLILHGNTPFLGICVGMQILFEHSEEGDCACLGWLKGNVVRFDSTKVRVPQMGWNEVHFTNNSHPSGHFYFVNSYYASPASPTTIWATATYNTPFTAAVKLNNIHATQFHTEKSGKAGLSLLKNFFEQ